MNTGLLLSYADKSGKTMTEVEEIWNEVEEEADKKFDKRDGAFWGYVNGTVKKRLKLKKSDFKESAESGYKSW